MHTLKWNFIKRSKIKRIWKCRLKMRAFLFMPQYVKWNSNADLIKSNIACYWLRLHSLKPFRLYRAIYLRSPMVEALNLSCLTPQDMRTWDQWNGHGYTYKKLYIWRLSATMNIGYIISFHEYGWRCLILTWVPFHPTHYDGCTYLSMVEI